jgi:undecaprenyl-diphosphatase
VTLLSAILSGILQGLTEFLPVSSSGHLVLLHSFIGFKESQMIFDIFLHLGTLLAVIVFFRDDILKLFTSEKKDLSLLGVAMIPAAAAGILFYSFIENFFSSPRITGYLLLLNGCILFLASYIQTRKNISRESINSKDAFLIGLSQVLGLLPGISRSGVTISTGLFRKLDYKKAITFSFLLSVVAISGAVLFQLISNPASLNYIEYKNVIAGLLAAFISGIISIRFLINVLKKKKFWIFGVYSVILGLITIILVNIS